MTDWTRVAAMKMGVDKVERYVEGKSAKEIADKSYGRERCQRGLKILLCKSRWMGDVESRQVY